MSNDNDINYVLFAWIYVNKYDTDLIIGMYVHCASEVTRQFLTLL